MENNLLLEKNGQRLVVLNLNYDGKDEIWDIFLNVKNKKVIEKLCEVLSDLNLRFSE